MTRIEPLVTITKRTHHARTRLPWLLCALVIRAWKYRAEKAEAELNKRASPPPVNNQRHLTRPQTGGTRDTQMSPTIEFSYDLIIGQR
jgi:hypothetical protein